MIGRISLSAVFYLPILKIDCLLILENNLYNLLERAVASDDYKSHDAKQKPDQSGI